MSDSNSAISGPAGSFRATARLRVIALLALLAGLGLAGCEKIRVGFGDPCYSNRLAYDYASNKVTGFKGRGVEQTSPHYQLAVDEVARAREILISCEARYAGT